MLLQLRNNICLHALFIISLIIKIICNFVVEFYLYICNVVLVITHFFNLMISLSGTVVIILRLFFLKNVFYFLFCYNCSFPTILWPFSNLICSVVMVFYLPHDCELLVVFYLNHSECLLRSCKWVWVLWFCSSHLYFIWEFWSTYYK